MFYNISMGQPVLYQFHLEAFLSVFLFPHQVVLLSQILIFLIMLHQLYNQLWYEDYRKMDLHCIFIIAECMFQIMSMIFKIIRTFVFYFPSCLSHLSYIQHRYKYIHLVGLLISIFTFTYSYEKTLNLKTDDIKDFSYTSYYI